MRRYTKGVRQTDVLGILLNRSEKGNSNTISLFINGVRHGEPVEIPEPFKDQTLVPHVNIKHCSLELNTFNVCHSTYPFTVRPIGDALDCDVVLMNFTTPEQSEVVLPIGNITKEWVDKYMEAHKGERIANLTTSGFLEWYQKSGAKIRNMSRVDHEFQVFMENMIFMKKRKYLLSFSNNLHKRERKVLTDRLGGHTKISALVDDELLNALPKVSSDYKFYSIPLDAEKEGFTGNIAYTESMEKSEEIFKNWVKSNRAHCKVDGFRVSGSFKEKIAEWKKFVEESKKDAEKVAAEKKEAEEKEKKEAEEKAKLEAEKKKEEESKIKEEKKEDEVKDETKDETMDSKKEETEETKEG